MVVDIMGVNCIFPVLNVHYRLFCEAFLKNLFYKTTELSVEWGRVIWLVSDSFLTKEHHDMLSV